MTYIEAKEKLHDYIEHADEQKIMDMLSLFEPEAKTSGYVYSEATLNMLRVRREDYLTDKSTLSSPEESIARIQQERKKNGLQS
jgi:hypothetical protein